MGASDARSLADRLARLDDSALTDLFARRHVAPTANWEDGFDAADFLLDPASLSRALIELTAAEAAALDDALRTGAPVTGPARDGLLAFGLIDDDGTPYAAVAAAREHLVRIEIPVLEADAAADAAVEAERAFAATLSLADILHSALTTPPARIGSGGLGAADRRRLVESGAVPDATAADDLVAIAERTGLLAVDERRWLLTRTGLAWLGIGTADRWRIVAERLRTALAPGIRSAEGGWIPADEWPAAHPFDPSWPDRAVAARALLQRWAMIDPSGRPTAWAAGLAAGSDADLAALEALLPPEVDRVYLQNDLTAIAPGPLSPHLDLRLRSMAQRESRAQASSYRFTTESLSDALTAGETAASLRSFLEEISLTGLPQPLAYEIDRSAARHGAIRVGPDWAGRTRVTGADESLLRAVAVDQALRPLGLVRDGDALVTRSGVDTAFWMIADARYPVVAVDADGQRRTLDRHRLADEQEPALDETGPYATLLARLRSAHAGDTDAAWLERELDQAVRGRATVAVTVRLPDGSEREITLEATGLGGGRLRGRDRGADVERTLPVSSIVTVTTIDTHRG